MAAPVSLTLLVTSRWATPRDRRYLGCTEPGPGCGTFLSRRQTVSDATAPAPVVLDPVSIVRSGRTSRRWCSRRCSASRSPRSPTASALVGALQGYLFEGLPADLFDGAAPAWWPVPWLALCGLLVALTIRYLPGRAATRRPSASPSVVDRRSTRYLPGVVLASFATLSLGAVLSGGAADRHRVRAGRAYGSAGRRTPRRWP